MKPKATTLSLALAILALAACRNDKITGYITGYDPDSLFLYKSKSESLYDLSPLAAVPVTGAKFVIDKDSIELGLYCISLQNAANGDPPGDYAFLFLEPVDMNIVISKTADGKMNVQASGSHVEDKFAAFGQMRRIEVNSLAYDSLNQLFYKAREAADTAEMRRIKKLSISCYDRARGKLNDLIAAQIAEHKRTYFAFYLYNAYYLPSETMNTLDEIAAVRNHINSYDEASRNSSFYRDAQAMLDRRQKCAVGCEAPGITGIDQEGNTQNLSSFKGKYVLVDFWSSGCNWCRLEIPNLLKTYHRFKNKGFTILGVSLDYNESDWKNAIEEDKSHWNQILLSADDINLVAEEYGITGIPHIILVDPDGIIVAKELRGDDIYDTVEKLFD